MIRESFESIVPCFAFEVFLGYDANGDGDQTDPFVGTAGFAPRLTAGTCLNAGEITSLSPREGLGGAPAAIVVGTHAASLDLLSPA